MNRPLVSILIPAYNAEKWIADTIRSALAQTWKPKEIIIIDDGSNDHTLDVARRFESESVRIFRQENQGAAAARNKAFSLSLGDYIQWLDADDLLAPDKIARQMEVVQSGCSPRTLLSSSWGHFIHRPYRARFTPTSLWCDLSPADFLVRKLEHKVFMQTAVWLVSRELTEAAGPWDTSMISDDDGEYFSRILLASDGVRFVRESRVYYRLVGSVSLSYVGQSDRKLDALWRSMQLHISHLRSLEDTERVRRVCIQYLQNYLLDFYPLRIDIVRQMHQAAEGLGGRLHGPRLSWKYSWIKTLFGWSWARRAQLFLPNVKWSMVRSWDRALFRIGGRGLARTHSGL
jgi:glycosyltransferase involved in cell wall biosynthesis